MGCRSSGNQEKLPGRGGGDMPYSTNVSRAPLLGGALPAPTMAHSTSVVRAAGCLAPSGQKPFLRATINDDSKNVVNSATSAGQHEAWL